MIKKSHKKTILIVDDDPVNLTMLRELFMKLELDVHSSRDGKIALKLADKSQPDLILLDIVMPDLDGFETCRRLKENENTRGIPVIFMTSLSEIEDKVKGFELGAVDFITKPFQNEEVLARVTTHLTLRGLQKEQERANIELERRVEERTADLSRINTSLRKEIAKREQVEEQLRQLKNQLQAENIYLQEEIKLEHNFNNIVGRNSIFTLVLRNVEKVASTDATVLILGETGTGKELIARAIHNISNRKQRPLVKVNCAALSPSIIESELFGHEKGAFTGAFFRKIGRFELANGGTLFLDEIGELPNDLQTKILRVLQEGEFERLGSSATRRVDVRVLAATNRNLQKAMENGYFREDLFYRLNVFPLTVPPLRSRKDDIPVLVKHFVKKYSSKMGKTILTVSKKVMDSLMAYSWPGNIRELENVIERAIILATNSTLNMETLSTLQNPVSFNVENVKAMEREQLVTTLVACNWIIEGKRGAAGRLEMPPSTLRDRMKKYGIKKPS